MFSPLPLERQGTLASQPGPYFFEEIGEKNTRDFAPWTPMGKEFLSPTPFLWTVVEAAIFFYRRTWPAASKTNASWPAHRLGRAGEVVYCREEKVGTRTVTFCLLPQRAPTHVPSPPSRWAGRYGPFNVRAAGQVISESTASPTQPHQRRGSRGEEPPPRGSFPHFFPRNGAPAGQAKVPFIWHHFPVDKIGD